MQLAHIDQTIASLKPRAIELLQTLVRIPSITGDEENVQQFLAGYLREIGLEVDIWSPQRSELQDHPAFSDDGLPLGKRSVIVARWRGGKPGSRTIALNGHVDVVPVGDGKAWKDGPWSGTYRDGFIWGRGSCDMKGGLVSGILALLALQKMGIQPPGDVLLQSVIGEETGGVGTLATVLRGYRADAAIVLEPTRLAICPVGAGAASFRLHITGRAAHGAMRLEGISAIEKFQTIYSTLQSFETDRHRGFHHPFYKDGELVAPLSVGKVSAGDWPSTVPETLIAEGRYGILPGENISHARKLFEQTVDQAASSDPWLCDHRPKVEWFEGQFEPANTRTDAPIISALIQAHEEFTGSRPAIHGVPYGSDLRFFTNNANMDAVLYGPGDVAIAHSLDERISMDEVLQVATVVTFLLCSW